MIPKIIWRYWDQGWDNVPFMVGSCSQSIAHYAQNWKVVNLDKNNVSDYITLPSCFFEEENYPIQLISDYIRVQLLKKFGGVWIDATVFLNTNLDVFFEQIDSDFFCFWRWPAKVSMSNWFMASTPSGYIVNKLAEAFTNTITSPDWISKNKKYFKLWFNSPNYYQFHREFETLATNDQEFQRLVQLMPFHSSTPIVMNVFNGWNKPITNESVGNILHDAPMLKLSHRVRESEYNKENSTLAVLMKKMNRPESLQHYPHLHDPRSFRTIMLFDSFLNRPNIIGDMAGIFDSEGNLGIDETINAKYHVISLPSSNKNENTQILIPHGMNRLFLRFQVGNNFSTCTEFVSKTEIDELRKKITNLEQELAKLTKQKSRFSFLRFFQKSK